ncbi:hypothetical protein Pyn_01744 [Prunus yedoensis var. nudiflora]|uniref:Uncharacterized protein n=1 Tax=Prunus yedoensis var. nudiflora TaxID=2094558 RepID=A0A314XZA3_PRUYE|nr:hypothetical protein Pyn_01744 [Prunus yedoensis var. nudiflora]
MEKANELDQANAQQPGESAQDASEIQQKGEQHPVSTTNKTTGKQSKQGSQASDPPKEEYIHVRARRGQATNSHSLAEDMLDEIINYVQSLQRQVEFLSMKLATVNPRLDFNIEGLLTKDILQSRVGPSSTRGFLRICLLLILSYIHLNQDLSKLASLEWGTLLIYFGEP